jgi:excisionase family DNA binding protein
MSRRQIKTIEPAEKLYSAQEIAERFGVKSQTVLEWYHAGVIPARVAYGRTYRFELAEVTNALAEHAAERQIERDVMADRHAGKALVI